MNGDPNFESIIQQLFVNPPFEKKPITCTQIMYSSSNSDIDMDFSDGISLNLNSNKMNKTSSVVSVRTPPTHLKDRQGSTKCICTIGPATASRDMIPKLVEAGVNVFRINMAHASNDFVLAFLENLKEFVSQTNSTAEVGVWLDINGPKVRTGKLKDGKPVYITSGQEFYFVNDSSVVGDETKISTTYPKKIVNVGDRMYVDDGLLAFTVVERLSDSIRCIAENDGYLGENKGVNFPKHVVEDLPTISPKDLADIEFALKHQVDFISVSCIRNIDDVEEVRMLLGNSKTKLLAKIENGRGMDNFESILKMTDGIVIDRGYLSAEIDLDLVPVSQKRMIAMANAVGKPIIVANQVLESMTNHPRPSRSEVADVANAVMDGVDGLVLSSETAIGEYAIDAIVTMRKIVMRAEQQTNYNDYQHKLMRSIPKPISVSESIASSAVTCARQVDAAVIIVFTEIGGTARLVAKYRPQVPVIAATIFRSTARQLNMFFGLVPYYHPGETDTIVHEALRYAVELGLAKPGQIAILTSGQVIGFVEGTTTKMQVARIPDFS